AVTAIVPIGFLAVISAMFASADLPEHDGGAVFATTHLGAFRIPLLPCAPDAAGVSSVGRGCPQRQDVHATIRFVRCHVDRSRTAAPVVVPWHSEFSCSGFNRGDDTGGNATVDVTSFLVHHDLVLRSRRGSSPAAEVLQRRPRAASAPGGAAAQGRTAKPLRRANGRRDLRRKPG